MKNLAAEKPECNRTAEDAGLVKRLSTGLRTALILVTVVATVYVAYGFGRLLAEWRRGGQVARPASVTTPALESMAAVLPVAGPWSFASLDWNVTSHTLSAADVEARFESLVEDATDGEVDDYPDADDDLFEYAEMLKIQPVDRGRNLLYRLDRDDLKATMVVRPGQGKPKAIGLALALPLAEGRWQFIELKPRAAERLEAKADHLLPLPPGAIRSGGRFAEDGTLLLELVSLESNAGQLLAQWKKAGWQVRPSGLGGPGEFSFLCGRGNDVVYAWSANPGDSLTSLMLVRAPRDGHTDARRSLATQLGE